MKHEFEVADMTCGHCASRISRSLKTFDPDAAVAIDVAAHRVAIDGAAGRDDYAYVIRDAGYTPA